MNGQPIPPGKSKTDLRRGHFTPGHAGTAKPGIRIPPKATSNDEQAVLFADAEIPHDATLPGEPR